jgi:hypothetical protein
VSKPTAAPSSTPELGHYTPALPEVIDAAQREKLCCELCCNRSIPALSGVLRLRRSGTGEGGTAGQPA